MADDLINLPENWEGAPIFFNDVFLAVVGKLGNGKSSVANSILGKPAFISDDGAHMITRASKMKSTILNDGRHVHVIDTPGLVNFSASPEFVGREIEKCIDLAKDGLHAVLMVFTMRARFTKEEENAIRYLKIFFGDKIIDYLIVVLAGGDVLEKKKITFSEWIKDCPEPLKITLLYFSMESDLREQTPTSNEISIAIVGLSRNGKSATGNTILGREAFISDYGWPLVTHTTEMKSTMLDDGRALNVIDTPGLFNYDASSEFIDKEILKSIDLAKDGLHAVLMVFSTSCRFTWEDVDVINHIKDLFGDMIFDYMIIVYTGGDNLEAVKKPFEEYIRDPPEPLENLIHLCKNRVVLFNNETKDKVKRQEQVNLLISLVNSIVASNDGKPFSIQGSNLSSTSNGEGDQS